MTPSASLPRVLFVCVENSNRSQLAEAFARIHGGRRIEAYGAGSRPSALAEWRYYYRDGARRKLLVGQSGSSQS